MTPSTMHQKQPTANLCTPPSLLVLTDPSIIMSLAERHYITFLIVPQGPNSSKSPHNRFLDLDTRKYNMLSDIFIIAEGSRLASSEMKNIPGTSPDNRRSILSNPFFVLIMHLLLFLE